MSSVQHLRDFIGERLTTAATEIFAEFEKTIVRYEEELARSRRLLDISGKPEITPRIDPQQEHDYTAEQILADQQFCNQEWNSSLDQEDPKPPRVKADHEKLDPESPQILEEPLQLKQETDPFLVTVLDDESDLSEVEPDGEPPDSLSSVGTQYQDQDSGSNQNTKLSPMKMDHINGNHSNDGNRPETSERSFICGGFTNQQQHVYNKTFINSSLLNVHIGSIQSQKSIPCEETFSQNSHLVKHLKIHRVRSPNSDNLQHRCPTCGRVCASHSSLVTHIRSHTGEKPFSCKVCGRRFSTNGNCKIHMRVHTGEKPYSCNVCGTSFSFHSRLKDHMRVHMG